MIHSTVFPYLFILACSALSVRCLDVAALWLVVTALSERREQAIYASSLGGVATCPRLPMVYALEENSHATTHLPTNRKRYWPYTGEQELVGSFATRRSCQRVTKGYAAALGALLLVCTTGLIATPLQAVTFPTPTRSTNIALTSDDRKLLVVNRESDSLSIIEVRNANGADRRQISLPRLPWARAALRGHPSG